MLPHCTLEYQINLTRLNNSKAMYVPTLNPRGVLRLVASVKWSRRIDMSLYQQSIFLVPKNFASKYNFFMKIRNSFVEKFHTVTAVSRVREVGDSELSNICGQQSSVSLLCIVCSCAQAAAVKLFSRKKISYMNDISF